MVQLLYKVNSSTRIVIQHAYGDAQTILLIMSTAVWTPAVVAMLIRIIGLKKTKSRVFRERNYLMATLIMLS